MSGVHTRELYQPVALCRAFFGTPLSAEAAARKQSRLYDDCSCSGNAQIFSFWLLLSRCCSFFILFFFAAGSRNFLGDNQLHLRYIWSLMYYYHGCNECIHCFCHEARAFFSHQYSLEITDDIGDIDSQKSLLDI